MERKLYLLSPLQAEFYENESDRMYPDDVMDGRALAVYGADILQKMQERADHVGEDLMEYYDEKDSVKEKVTNLELSVVLKAGELMGNVFSILGDASRLLKQNGQPEAAKEMFDRVTSSQSYEQALAIISEYVETELSRDMDQPKPEKQGKKKTERER